MRQQWCTGRGLGTRLVLSVSALCADARTQVYPDAQYGELMCCLMFLLLVSVGKHVYREGWCISEILSYINLKVQLGFDGTIIIVTSTSNKDYAGGDPIPRYGGGTGNTYSFTCIGHENHLINCESGLLNVGIWCSHDDDAGVMCHNNGILMYLHRIV